MAASKNLLIVYHSRSGNTRRMADAVIDAARSEAVSGVSVKVRDAFAATADDVRAAHGIILGTPENFGYMSGAMKCFFENIYYACLEHTQGLPYGLFIRAGNDGQGALSSMTRIITGLRWREVTEPVLISGEFDEARLEECRELGLAFAAALESGVF